LKKRYFEKMLTCICRSHIKQHAIDLLLHLPKRVEEEKYLNKYCWKG